MKLLIEVEGDFENDDEILEMVEECLDGSAHGVNILWHDSSNQTN